MPTNDSAVRCKKCPHLKDDFIHKQHCPYGHPFEPEPSAPAPIYDEVEESSIQPTTGANTPKVEACVTGVGPTATWDAWADSIGLAPTGTGEPTGAGELASLRASLSRITKERDDYLETAQRIQGDFERAKEAFAAAETREKALREALQNLVGSAVTEADMCAICGNDINQCSPGCAVEIAVAALSSPVFGYSVDGEWDW